MRNIIVFGATGHIGAYTVDWLLHNLDLKQYHIIASGRRPVEYYANQGIDYVQLDICDSESFIKLPVQDIYCVIHLAGIMPAVMHGYTPYPFIDVNVRGTLNVLEYCKRVHCSKIIVTTTEADLSGYWQDNAIIKPDLIPKFDYSSNYAMYIISRRTVLDMLECYKAQCGLTYFAIRCSNVYCFTPSPYMYKFGKRIIPGYRQIYEKAENGDPIEVWGNPAVKTEIVYVKDFAQLVERMVLDEENHYGIYNLGNGMPVTLEDQIKIAIKVFGSPSHYSKVIYRPDMPTGRNFVQDISKCIEDLNYQPVYDYQKYLEDYKCEKKLNRFDSLFAIEKC